jgi:protease-4
VAASGGYWIATPGRHIVAQPNTITGSIGVLAGKIYNSGLLAKLFVNEELISRGNRSLFGDESAFTEEERRKVRSLIERMYDMFLDRVSESRKLSRDVVDAVGGGRVWTGRQALAHGLVDELGGLDQAIAKARALAGLGPRSPLRIFHPGGGGLAPLPSTADALAYALDGLRLFNEAGPLCLLPLTWSTDN